LALLDTLGRQHAFARSCHRKARRASQRTDLDLALGSVEIVILEHQLWIKYYCFLNMTRFHTLCLCSGLQLSKRIHIVGLVVLRGDALPSLFTWRDFSAVPVTTGSTWAVWLLKVPDLGYYARALSPKLSFRPFSFRFILATAQMEDV
jgi:hypothetical protein